MSMRRGKSRWWLILGVVLLMYVAGCVYYAADTYAHGEQNYKAGIKIIMDPMQPEIQSQVARIEHTTQVEDQWKETAQLVSYLNQKHMNLYSLNNPREYHEQHQQLHKELASIFRMALKAESLYLEGKPEQAQSQLQSLLHQYEKVEQTKDTILDK